MRFAGWLLLATMTGVRASRAQAGTTVVQDTVLAADGTAAAGSVVVSWSGFVTATGLPVAAGHLTVTLGAGGALRIALFPNAGATPMGSYYTAVYRLTDGTTSREFWVVPALSSGSVGLASIRNQTLPLTVAMQTVSKAYVDTTVAKAMAGTAPGGPLPYLLRQGDTLSGPLVLAGDPVSGLQAASKHYVDAAVASSGGGAGVAGGDLGGPFTNLSVRAVHATSGTLDGVTVGGATPAAGSFSTLHASGTATLSNLQVVPTTDQLPAFSVSTIYGAGTFLIDSYGGVFLTQPILSPGYTTDARGGNPPVKLYSTSAAAAVTSQSTNAAAVCIHGFLNSAGTQVACVGQSGTLHETLATPASSSAPCSAGDFGDDANFHYVCVSANAWKRVALVAF